jgi:hypothetical protein
MLRFAGGGIVSLYQGVSRSLHPRPLDHLAWNYAILVISALAAGYSFRVADREFRSKAGTDEDLLPAIYGRKDPSTFTILFEDGAALAGLLIAFLGLLFAQILQKPSLDAIASIGIALILMIAAALLGNEARGLLVGEGARQATLRKICERVEADPAVEAAGLRYHVSRTGYRFAGARRSFPSHPSRFPRIRDIYLQADAFTSVLRSDTNSSTQAAKVVLGSCISEPTIRPWQWDGMGMASPQMPPDTGDTGKSVWTGRGLHDPLCYLYMNMCTMDPPLSPFPDGNRCGAFAP